MPFISVIFKSAPRSILWPGIPALSPATVLALLLWLASTPLAHAAIYESEQVRISGFTTIGVARGGNDILGHRRNVAQKGQFDNDLAWETDSLIGIQLDTSFSQSLDAAIQAVAKKRFNNSVENSIEWAYLRYRHDRNLTFRAGRIGLDVYMLSDYRSVGFSYLWARPPMEFYSPSAFFYFDGIDINYSFDLGRGLFSAKLFFGESENQFEFDNEGRDFKLKNGRGLALAWENEHWLTRFTYLTLDFDRSLNKAVRTEEFRAPLMAAYQAGWTQALELFEDIEVGNNGIDYYALGISYDNAPWVIQSEINLLDSDYELIPPYSGRYFSVGYRIGDVTVYSLLAKGYRTESRKKISELPPAPASVPAFVELRENVVKAFNSLSGDQESLSLGMRWNIRYDTALKLQWDHSRVEPAGGFLWEQREPPEKTQSLNTYSINLNYIF